MRTEALVLYATNTGALYQEHLNLARNQADETAWRRHITTKVLPAYRKEMREPWEGMCIVGLETVAAELAAYYAEQIAAGA